MISLARPTQSRQYYLLFKLKNCFVLRNVEKLGRKDGHCENNNCGSAVWINKLPYVRLSFPPVMMVLSANLNDVLSKVSAESGTGSMVSPSNL